MNKEITESNLLDIMSKSGDDIFVSMAKDIQKWKGLKHNKESLELFLNNNISEIYYVTKSGDKKMDVVCSNTILIKMFSMKMGSNYDKKISELKKMRSHGIHTNDTKSILSWSFIKNKYITINLNNWNIGRFITIDNDNVDILNKVLRKMLKNYKDTVNKNDKR